MILNSGENLSKGLLRRNKPAGRQGRFTAVINKEEKWYVARCVELNVVSQGKTIEEAQINLKEAVELYLESFDPDDYPDSDSKLILY